jgi:uncharacterized protein (TIGR02145 family)
MSKVNGKDAVLYKYNETTLEWVPFGCARSITLDISREMVETSITGNGVFKTYIPGAGSVTGTIEGLVFINWVETDMITMKTMYDYIIQGAPMTLKYYEEDTNGTTYLKKEITAYIESLNETSSFDNMNTFTANFRGIGAPTITSEYIFNGPKVTIGDQIWTTQNFNGATYKNGDLITFCANSTEWIAANTAEEGAWCYFNFETDSYYTGLGKLYNFYAIKDARGIGYNGWHIPTEAEWSTLKDYGPVNSDLLSIKESGSIHWNTANGNNNTGLTLIGSGQALEDGTFGDLRNGASFWINEDLGGGYGNGFSYYDWTDFYVNAGTYGAGKSLRFIKD